MIQKKGDVEDVGDYRPICSLPALYKLCTVQQILPRLDQIQAEDQAVFRSSFPKNGSSGDIQDD